MGFNRRGSIRGAEYMKDKLVIEIITEEYEFSIWECE